MGKVNYELLHPTYKALYDVVGEENMLKIHKLFRGTQLQLPMKLYDRLALEDAISSSSFDDKSVQEISLEYGFSPRWVQKIITNRKNRGK